MRKACNDVARQILPRCEADFTDAEFLAEFDLDRPELKAVRKAVDGGDIDTAREALVQHFKTRKRPYWLFDLRNGQKGHVSHLWHTNLCCDKTEHKKRADLLLQNRFTIAPYMELDLGKKLNWTKPEYRQSGIPGSFLKCSHFLRDLAVVHGETRNPVYAEKFSELVSKWIRDWPFECDDDFNGDGFIFSKRFAYQTMPTAHRLLNMITSLQSGIAYAPQVAPETAFALIKSLWFTATAYAPLEKIAYNHTNHHILATCHLPAVMAMYFPETPRLRAMFETARSHGRRHIEKSFLSDRGYVERSSKYAMITLEMFLAPLHIARKIT